MRYNYSSSAYGLMAGMTTGYVVVMLAFAVFAIVCMWRIFEKAGEAGWKSLIPIYNAYVYYGICWETKYFIYTFLAVIAVAVISGAGLGANSNALAGIGGFLIIIVYLAIAVLGIIAMVKLAKRFGKSGGFAVGLILLSPIFLGILAFGDADYDRSRA